MKIVKIILAIVVVALAGWLIAAFSSSSNPVVEKSIVINAPVETIFAQVNTLKNWEKWNYWQLLEPEQKMTYDGPPSGVGASYSWDGKKTKKGSLTITESVPYQTIKITLDFKEQGAGNAEWKFEEGEGAVKVSEKFWSDDEMSLTDKLKGGFLMSMFLGKAFKADLEKLKEVAESAPVVTPALSAYGISEVNVPEQWVLAIRDTVKIAEIGPVLGQLYGRIMGELYSRGLKEAGQPLAIWHLFEPENDFADMEAGIPVADSTISISGMRLVKIGGNTVKATHFGDYEKMQPTYDAITAWMKEKGLSPRGANWEIYITDPMNEPDTAKWQTDIYFPI